MMRRAVWALLLALACSGGDAQVLGSPCEGGDDCGTAANAACILRWPAGYCTEVDCTLGSCPLGSSCVRGIAFRDVSFDAFCLDECESENDCRDGYRCSSADDTRVCVPAG